MSEIYELRQYTLHPGRRDALIDLFDREFVEPQEACGIRVVGQFRDRSDADRFVWLRAFPDMVSRQAALTCFYRGPVWKAHRDEANATMIDSDDVLLLRLVEGKGGVPPPQSPRPRLGATERPSSRFAITIYSFRVPITDELLNLVRHEGTALTLLQSEPAENTYPALPVRTGEHVIVALSSEDLTNGPERPELTSHLASPPQRLTLEPTARSMMR